MEPNPFNPPEPRRGHWVPHAAVAAVAVAAIGTAVMVKRADTGARPEAAAAVAAAGQGSPVVNAPPLKPLPTPSPPQRPDTRAMGGSAACSGCGVVEMVVAVHEHAKPLPSGYQMHIRMDDGSIRTVQQRGAMAAGSRVIVDGSSVRGL